jgi:hypothetical protein
MVHPPLVHLPSPPPARVCYLTAPLRGAAVVQPSPQLSVSHSRPSSAKRRTKLCVKQAPYVSQCV